MSVSVGFWGSLLRWGGCLARGLYRPPPFQLKARLPYDLCMTGVIWRAVVYLCVHTYGNF